MHIALMSPPDAHGRKNFHQSFIASLHSRRSDPSLYDGVDSIDSAFSLFLGSITVFLAVDIVSVMTIGCINGYSAKYFCSYLRFYTLFPAEKPGINSPNRRPFGHFPYSMNGE